MKKIELKLENNTYEIIINSDIAFEISKELKKIKDIRNIVIITQQAIYNLYSKILKKVLHENGLEFHFIILDDNENAKSLITFSKVINSLIEFNCNKSSIIFAFGGGVVGDLSGFVASTYMRGISYYQIPTTFLSIIDSSIGGKTAINTDRGKNLIGTIYQPKKVFINPNFMNSLPLREISSGMGELIKYGLIWDKDFLNDVLKYGENNSQKNISYFIYKSCQIKSQIVEKDEKDKGLRKILNFGHTIGHALESYFEYETIKHGESVALGMICESWISKEMGLIESKTYESIHRSITSLSLPKINKIDKKKFYDFILKDKKHQSKKLNFVLLKGIGKPVIDINVQKNLILKSLDVII